MRMTFRWYGRDNDTISLKMIRQIPGVKGIVWALHDIPAGEAWPEERIADEVSYIKENGFDAEVVESVNVHESIKLGISERDSYIENYKETIIRLSKHGVKVICYNFMPVFDWLRTDLQKELPDGSTALYFDKNKIAHITPQQLVDEFGQRNDGLTLPGWEPERLTRLKELFDQYTDVSEDDLWENLKYFLKAIVPVAEAHGIKMAIHPDDPPFSIFGLPRIITSQENLRKLINLIDSPSNAITLCSGSLGSVETNDIISMINEFQERIPFAHVRNVKRFEDGSFVESSHWIEDGSVDIVGIMQAYHENNFIGYVRPDHGRHIWNEVCRPGYGLYDRALGIMYLLGIWDSENNKRNTQLF